MNNSSQEEQPLCDIQRIVSAKSAPYAYVVRITICMSITLVFSGQ
jgi:hypothetical protein